MDERTQTHRREAARRVAPSADQAPEALPQLPTVAPGVTRRTEARVKCFSDWIEHEPKEKWSLLHNRGGARYGVMTINLA